jgi:hypothetical protein
MFPSKYGLGFGSSLYSQWLRQYNRMLSPYLWINGVAHPDTLSKLSAKPDWASSVWDSIQKNPSQERAGGVGSRCGPWIQNPVPLKYLPQMTHILQVLFQEPSWASKNTSFADEVSTVPTRSPKNPEVVCSQRKTRLLNSPTPATRDEQLCTGLTVPAEC